ncbi:Uma2 family endonuclease [Myxosarcina sp. GI1]|uniref:Uma2 family endonuclease n=1 Tax=Myxosarcina sp. GI1 TaxID=1541065 RepID=UPI0005618EB6|nr:Uma2 family endonuclease [Myxosarcina sp. GI1]
MSALTKQVCYTPQQYLEFEADAKNKHEYRDGKIIPMAGSTTNHNKISLNFCRQFPLSINDRNYELYMGDIRLWIPRYRFYTYPDIMVIEDEPIYEGDKSTTVINPLLIIEVLSKSTSNYDRGDKFKYYRSISTFQEYVLIDQYSFAVEQYIKQAENKWLLQEYEGQNSVLTLTSVDYEIELKKLYHKVNLTED